MRLLTPWLAATVTRMSDELAWHDVVFATPPNVVEDRPYAIYVRAISSTRNARAARWVHYNDLKSATPDWYPRGRGFARAPGAAVWTSLPELHDFVFEVYMHTAACGAL